jgi:hypothetical protein
MPRPVHDVVFRLVSHFVAKAWKTGFIIPEEEDYISCGTTSVRLAQSGFHVKQNARKLESWTKLPDAVILFGDWESTPLPMSFLKLGLQRATLTWPMMQYNGLKNLVGRSDLLFL